MRKHLQIKEVNCIKCGAQHLAKRSDAQCAACRKAYLRSWCIEHAAYYRARYAASRAQERMRKKKYRDGHKVEASDYFKRYHSARPGLKNAWDAKRRSREKQATPAWANSFFIEEAYRLAKLREQVCGGKWHVDHIVPLQHPKVCGLHVENNLQVIPAMQNMQKSNTHWPQMP